MTDTFAVDIHPMLDNLYRYLDESIAHAFALGRPYRLQLPLRLLNATLEHNRYGDFYIVFPSNVDAEVWEDYFINHKNWRPVCFNGYDNAYEVPASFIKTIPLV